MRDSYKRKADVALAGLQAENNYCDILAHHISWKMVRLTFIVFVFLFVPQLARASGIAGSRFFPVTLAVDHPFVCDDLSFTFSHTQEPDRKTDELSFNYSKRITPDFGIELLRSP